jgi:hypothetical protein
MSLLPLLMLPLRLRRPALPALLGEPPSKACSTARVSWVTGPSARDS